MLDDFFFVIPASAGSSDNEFAKDTLVYCTLKLLALMYSKNSLNNCLAGYDKVD
jgi:hypothetical protein